MCGVRLGPGQAVPLVDQLTSDLGPGSETRCAGPPMKMNEMVGLEPSHKQAVFSCSFAPFPAPLPPPPQHTPNVVCVTDVATDLPVEWIVTEC